MTTNKIREQLNSSIISQPNSVITLSFLKKLVAVETLRKLAHAIYRDFFQKQKLKIIGKKYDILNIFVQNIDCGYTLEPPRRGGSNEYPQSIFWSKNKKIRYTPANPSFSV